MYIPYGRQWIEEDDIQAVVEALQSDYLTTGPRVDAFEKEFAAYVGAKYAVAVSNGTAALHIACMAAEIGPGDEVITSPITFVASANCAFYCGATPIFADIDPVTYNISPASIREKITARTKAIIAVHFAGQPCEMEEIRQIAKEHNCIVIEDAAHALGATYHGKKIGSISEMTTFSLHPVKHITTGEGGVVTTNDERLYQRLQLLRSHGITRDEGIMENKEGDWYYEQIMLGYNYRMTDIQCALGSSQLKKLDNFIQKRKEIVQRYETAFEKIANVVTPKCKEWCNSSWHLYVIQVKGVDRKQCFDYLREKKIGVNVHYIPVYKQPYYQKNGYESVYCEQAEKVYKAILSLPIYPLLSEEEQNYVIKHVLISIQKFR